MRRYVIAGIVIVAIIGAIASSQMCSKRSLWKTKTQEWSTTTAPRIVESDQMQSKSSIDTPTTQQDNSKRRPR